MTEEQEYNRITYHVVAVANKQMEAVGWSFYSSDRERSCYVFKTADEACEEVNAQIECRMNELDPEDTTTDFQVQCHWMALKEEQ